jgi:hypothetical protein
LIPLHVQFILGFYITGFASLALVEFLLPSDVSVSKYLPTNILLFFIVVFTAGVVTYLIIAFISQFVRKIKNFSKNMIKLGQKIETEK